MAPATPPARLRILFYNHTRQVSGGERMLLTMLAALDRELYEPVSACPFEGPGELDTLLRGARVEVLEAPMLQARFTSNPVKLLGYLASFAQAVASFRGTIRKAAPHLLHAVSVRAGIVATLATIGTGTRILWHIQDDLPAHPISTVIRRFAQSSHRTGFVAVSQATAQAFKGKLNFGTRMHVLPNTIDRRRFPRKTAPLGAEAQAVRNELLRPPPITAVQPPPCHPEQSAAGSKQKVQPPPCHPERSAAGPDSASKADPLGVRYPSAESKDLHLRSPEESKPQVQPIPCHPERSAAESKDLHFCSPDANKSDQPQTQTSRPTLVVAVGMINPRKGLLELLEAWAHVQSGLSPHTQAQLAIVGAPIFNDDHLYEAALKARTRELGLEATVHFTGPRTDIPAILRAADLFVLNAKVEPFGLVILEAISSGTPVIATTVGGIPEIVTSGVTGELVPPPGQPGDALAERLLMAIQQPEHMQRLADRAYDEVLPRFAMRAFAQRLNALYASYAAEARSR